jgi:ornithine cyclodeaminase
MKIVSAEEVDKSLTFQGLVNTLRGAFLHGAVQPLRHHHTIEQHAADPVTLLLMPAWTDFTARDAPSGGYIGIKIATVAPGNNALGKPAVMATYLLLDGETGEPVAMIDGQRLTLWRTACASGLASSYLARKDAESLLVVGAGALAPFLAQAHAAVRPIRSIKVWNRSPHGAERVAAQLRELGFDAGTVADLDAAQVEADIISCATLSTVPLVKGRLLRQGTHVDLVGAFSPTMRESDDALMRRARIFADTRTGATKEGGDIVQPLQAGVIAESDIVADLYDLARGRDPGRNDDDEITVFKSVGAALEDLAAGIAVYEALSG